MHTPSAILDSLEAAGRRRAWIFGGVSAASLGGLLLVGTILSPPTAKDLTPYLGSIGMVLAFALGFPPLLSYNVKKQIRWLRPMAPEIREAGWPLTRGITLVLRDGTVLLFPGFSVICMMFFGPHRAVLRPSLSDVIRWTSVRSAVLSSRRLGITRGRARAPLNAELKALQDRIGATLSACVVREAKAHVADPASPQWMVSVVFASPFSFGRLRADLVAAELTAIGVLMRRTLETFAISAGSSQPRRPA